MTDTPTDHWPQLVFELRAGQLGHHVHLLPQRQDHGYAMPPYRWACTCGANDDTPDDKPAAKHPDLALQRWARHVIVDAAADAAGVESF